MAPVRNPYRREITLDTVTLCYYIDGTERRGPEQAIPYPPHNLKRRGQKMITREQMKQVQETLNKRSELIGVIVESVCDGLEQSGVRTSFSKSDYGKGRWNASMSIEFTATEKEEA